MQSVSATKEVKKTERGWGGHFCAASGCRFRRNTLLEFGRKRIVVSTVGNYWTNGGKDNEEIGCNRYYETMAFKAVKEGVFWEADVSKQIDFDSPWSISVCEQETDLAADAMHEAVVAELSSFLTK